MVNMWVLKLKLVFLNWKVKFWFCSLFLSHTPQKLFASPFLINSSSLLKWKFINFHVIYFTIRFSKFFFVRIKNQAPISSFFFKKTSMRDENRGSAFKKQIQSLILSQTLKYLPPEGKPVIKIPNHKLAERVTRCFTKSILQKKPRKS